MRKTLRKKIEKVMDGFNRSGSSEAVAVADHLDSLVHADLEKGEELECVTASLRELADYAEIAIGKLQGGRANIAAMIAGMLDGKEWSVETLDEIADVLRTAGYQVRDVDDDSEGDDANREMGLPDGDDWGNK